MIWLRPLWATFGPLYIHNILTWKDLVVAHSKNGNKLHHQPVSAWILHHSGYVFLFLLVDSLFRSVLIGLYFTKPANSNHRVPWFRSGFLPMNLEEIQSCATSPDHIHHV